MSCFRRWTHTTRGASASSSIKVRTFLTISWGTHKRSKACRPSVLKNFRNINKKMDYSNFRLTLFEVKTANLLLVVTSSLDCECWLLPLPRNHADVGRPSVGSASVCQNNIYLKIVHFQNLNILVIPCFGWLWWRSCQSWLAPGRPFAFVELWKQHWTSPHHSELDLDPG